MNWKHVGVGVLVAVLVIAVAGAVLFAGPGPTTSGTDDGSIDEFPTERPSDAETTGDDAGGDDGTDSDDGADSDDSTGSNGGTDDSTASTEEPPFLFSIDDVEECGTTCRDVTATVYNNRNETATGVTVYTRIFAGENNTDTDDLLWEGSTDVGTLEAGGSHTSTERVELSYGDALAIERNDGWITIVTTVESDEETVTFRDSEQVI